MKNQSQITKICTFRKYQNKSITIVPPQGLRALQQQPHRQHPDSLVVMPVQPLTRPYPYQRLLQKPDVFIFFNIKNSNVVLSKNTDFFFTNLNHIFVNSKLVEGQCAGFVTAQHIHPRHFFNRGHSFSNRTLFQSHSS